MLVFLHHKQVHGLSLLLVRELLHLTRYLWSQGQGHLQITELVKEVLALLLYQVQSQEGPELHLQLVLVYLDLHHQEVHVPHLISLEGDPEHHLNLVGDLEHPARVHSLIWVVDETMTVGDAVGRRIVVTAAAMFPITGPAQIVDIRLAAVILPVHEITVPAAVV